MFDRLLTWIITLGNKPKTHFMAVHLEEDLVWLGSLLDFNTEV